MNNNMQEVARDLKLAQIETRKLREEVEATTLWKSYQLALRKEGQLERQLECLQLEATRSELKEHFECVTGHQYDDYTNEFLIVHKDTPHITSIAGGDGVWAIGVKGKTTLPRDADSLVLASDDTEQGAWKRAVEEWEAMGEWQRDLFLGKS